MLLQRTGNRGMDLGTLWDRAAARHPANLVLLDRPLDVAPDRGQRLRVAEIADLVSDLATRLAAAQVGAGRRVVIYKRDNFDIPLLAYAAARLGAVPVMLSPQLDGEAAAQLLERAAPAHLVTDLGMLHERLPSRVVDVAEEVLLVDGEDERARSLARPVTGPRARPVHHRPGDPALVTHTSGTTGLPKLAVHTGFTLQARYRPQAWSAMLARRRETVAMHVSFVHSRMFSALAITMLRGVPLIVLTDDAPDQVAELFARFRPGVIEAHPNSLMRWEDLADDPREPFAAVKYFSTTFDAIHPRTMRRLLSSSRRAAPKFLQLYGQSETGPVVGRSYGRRRIEHVHGRCVGMPFPGMTAIRVVPRDGVTPSASTPGHIEARSDGLVRTFLGEPARYQEQLHDGWWRMGDVGYRSRWGCLHLLDRAVDAVEGIGSTLQIEDTILNRMPALTEVIVIAGADGLPLPIVAVRQDEPLDRRAWRAAVADLPPMAEPDQWRLEDLPQTATMKVKRIELSRILHQRGTDPAPDGARTAPHANGGSVR